MLLMDNFLLSTKEKSQAALTIGKAKPALSGRSEGEGARPTHYYWSFRGQETNSFGKGRHERRNRGGALCFISRPHLGLWFGGGSTEPSWSNNLELPYTMRRDLILPLGNCARGNVEQLGKRRRAASEIDCLLFIHAIL